MINYAQLQTELQSDPQALGYAAHVSVGNDTALAALLNQVRAGINIDRDVLSAHELFEAIVPAEWAALNATERQRIQTILSMGTVNIRGANTRSAFLASFAAGTTTRANLAALQTRQGSRAEQLFGSGVTVTHSDIAKALRG